MDECAGNVTDVCKIGQELSVRNFSQWVDAVKQFPVADLGGGGGGGGGVEGARPPPPPPNIWLTKNYNKLTFAGIIRARV